MNFLLRFLLSILILTGCASKMKINSASTQKEKIAEAIQNELKLYPKATLIDLYKNFFQGAFGPGHMIENSQMAVDYLDNELKNATEFDSVKWQPVGYNEKYFRVNLSLVIDSTISKNELVEAFVESANKAEIPSLESLKDEWSMILKVIEEMNLNLENFEEDKAALEAMLKDGKTVVHHSEAFNKFYHPHYRIISKNHFEKLITP